MYTATIVTQTYRNVTSMAYDVLTAQVEPTGSLSTEVAAAYYLVWSLHSRHVMSRCLNAERSDVINHPWWVVFVDSMCVEYQATLL